MASPRGRAMTLEPLARATRYPGFALGIGLMAWCCVVVAFPKLAIDAPDLIGVSRIGAAELFVIAGFACLARWLLIRQAAAMRTAIALVAIGCLSNRRRPTACTSNPGRRCCAWRSWRCSR
jgi:hypothetical protein